MDGTHCEPSGSIRVTQTPHATIVRLAGEIDVTLRAQASAALSLALRREMPVELDTSEVTFIDARGLSFMVQCSVLAASQGLPVSLRPAPSPAVRYLITSVGAGPFEDELRA